MNPVPRSPRVRSGRLLTAAVLTLVGLVLTGCLRVDVSLEVSENARISGHAVVAVRPVQVGDVGPQLQAPAKLDAKVESEPYDADGYVGTRLTFSELTTEEFRHLVEGGPWGDRYRLTVRQVNETLSVHGSLDLTQIPQEDADLGVVAEFPYEVSRTDGDAEGTRVSWSPEPGRVYNLNASVRSSGQDSVWAQGVVMIGGLTGSATVFVLMMALVSRRRSRMLPNGETPF
ncbi:LppM family (lipo)protein [Actinoalloteichus spitiensis]|uniref:LppM family (lipo)protein n=1 Tax=Actinoalloteichus spitiensis TaxID=252394 RepID=UPI0002E70ABE|nr:DUF3153 domain-containing protein [Actinoalloteichus spitiensis]